MLRSYEQKSPLNIYVEDSNKMFEQFKFEVAYASVQQFANYARFFKEQLAAKEKGARETRKLQTLLEERK